MEKIEQVTRELGVLIQQDARYIAYQEAKKTNDADEDLQHLIGEFNLKRMALNTEMSKPDKDRDKLKEMDEKIKELYGEIMANENMMHFNDVKNAMDAMLSEINTIITMSANGEDPMTCSAAPSCGGDCGSCGGCH